MIKVEILGRIPSKKNSKNLYKSKKTGKIFITASNKYKMWHKENVDKIRNEMSIYQADIFPIKNIKNISLNFTFGDKRKCDLTNKAESIMDLLVDVGVLIDDNWQEVSEILLTGKYEKNVFLCEIVINF